MDHEATWDEESGCVRFAIRGPFELEHARALCGRAEELLEGKARKFLLVDHTQSPQALPSDTRDYLRDRIVGIGFEKIAMFGMAHILRITAKILAAMTGYSGRTGFFKTEAEARAWLAE